MQHDEPPATGDLLTVRQFSQRFPVWTEPAIRNLILHAEDRRNSRGELISGNGLIEAGAVIRVGRKVLIRPSRFLGPWLTEQSLRAKRAKR